MRERERERKRERERERERERVTEKEEWKNTSSPLPGIFNPFRPSLPVRGMFPVRPVPQGSRLCASLVNHLGFGFPGPAVNPGLTGGALEMTMVCVCVCVCVYLCPNMSVVFVSGSLYDEGEQQMTMVCVCVPLSKHECGLGL